MAPNHGLLLYEGKAKRIFDSDKKGQVLVEFKNDTTAFNALKKSSLKGKGILNCQISSHLFELLEAQGVDTHYLGLVSDSWMAAKRVEIIPLEVVVRNIAFGSLCKETPITEGTELSSPLLDLYFKDDSLSDPLLTEARLELLGILSNNQRNEIETLVRKVNLILSTFFEKLDLILVDFKLEIGINAEGRLIVADEISPDTCRIWDARADSSSDRILDKDRFRKDLGGVVEAYAEILKRIQEISPNPRIYK